MERRQQMSDLIEEFGKAIDNILEESDVRMMVRLPEGAWMQRLCLHLLTSWDL